MSAVEFPEISGQPFAAAGDVDEPGDSEVVERQLTVVPDQADLVEWTPERAAAMVRALGLGLHTLDPAASLEGGEELWRATSTEAAEIGAPLSRILARYTPTRKLAGAVDEVELGAAFVTYAKRNMRTRGRVVLGARERSVDDFGGATSAGDEFVED